MPSTGFSVIECSASDVAQFTSLLSKAYVIGMTRDAAERFPGSIFTSDVLARRIRSAFWCFQFVPISAVIWTTAPDRTGQTRTCRLPHTGKTPLRRQLSHLFDDDPSRNYKAAQLFNTFLAALIIINVAAVILETVEAVRDRYPLAFSITEHAATAIFSVEYLLRLWTVVDLHDGQFAHPIWGRLRYMRSFFALIDLVAVLPALLGWLGAGDLRVLRLLRLLRMLKLTRHSKVFGLLWAVFREEAHSIGALVFILCLTLTISGALAYMIEFEEQPAMFSSIPASMWWAVETLTTVGYGDMVPATTMGKILGGLVSIIGIGTLALFSGVITVGFLDQLKIRREQASIAVRTSAIEHSRNNAPAPKTQDPGTYIGLTSLTIGAQIPAETACPRCGHILTPNGQHVASDV
jgi:voltage-gated potassium channel